MSFSCLSVANLVINLSKCEFVKGRVKYLGFVVGQGEVLPPSAKVLAILVFPVPQNKDVQRYLGIVGYYRRFMESFSKITAPFTNLLRKGRRFAWDDECSRAFQAVKDVLSTFPILRTPNFDKPFSIAVDACDVGTGAVLLEESDDGVLHPVSYCSKKFIPS